MRRPQPHWLAPWMWIIGALACSSTMIEVEGHRVFNPSYAVFLDSPERGFWQKPDQVIDALELPEDAVVADVGAGSGYFTERFSRRLAAGHVYATDVQEPMLERLVRRVQERELTNVEIVRSAFDDSRLPPACCDLIFFSSVYKEIHERVAYLRKLAAALRPAGRVAVLEFKPAWRGPGPPSDVRLASDQVIAEFEEAGYVAVESFDFLTREYFLVFSLP